MKSVQAAEELSREMLAIASLADRRAVALISDMNQPLGSAVGNALEVREAVETLKGGGPEDFKEHCIEVAGHMLVLAGRTEDIAEARGFVVDALQSGSALAKFRELVDAQHGDTAVLDDFNLLPGAAVVEPVAASVSGYLKQVDAREVGLTAVQLGAGREMKGDPIDHSVGIMIHGKVGDRVQKGAPLFTVHAHSRASCDAAVDHLKSAHVITDEKVEPLPLFYRTLQQDV